MSMTFNELQELAETRHSIRSFDTKKLLNKDEIEKILSIGHLAPSINNTQPWHFHVIHNNKLKQDLMDAACYGNFIPGASVFIIITCDKNACPQCIPHGMVLWNPKELEYSCAGAINEMMLAATSLNIGSCWVSLHHGKAHDILKLSPGHVVIGGLMLGHPAERLAIPEHDRKPLKDVVTVYP